MLGTGSPWEIACLMANEKLINHEEIAKKLAAAQVKLAKALAKSAAGRRGSQTTLIKADKVWSVTSLIWSESRASYVRDGKAVMVKRPNDPASPTANELARQKLLLVTEAALENAFAKTITV